MKVVLDLLHELTNTRIYGFFHNRMWQSRYSEVDVHLVKCWGWTDWLWVHNGSLRSIGICLFFRIGVLAVTRETCIDLLSKQRVSPFYHDLDLGWLGAFCLLSNFSFCMSSNFWTKFLHLIIFQGNFWKKSRWRMYFLVYDFSSFHLNNFRNTTSWECFSWKMIAFRSCLIEFQSFLLSKCDVDPIHSVLMFLPCFMHVLCKTHCFQVDRVRILMIFIHGIHKQKEYLWLKFWPPSINPMECKLIAHPTW